MSCNEITKKNYREASFDRIEKDYGRYIRSSHVAAIIGGLLGIAMVKNYMPTESLAEMYAELPYFQALLVHGGLILIMMLGAAYSIFALYAGLSITSKYVLKSKWIIIVLIVFWPLGIALIILSVFIGYYASIPYYIKNRLEYRKRKREVGMDQ
jgi:hypothetical protein